MRTELRISRWLAVLLLMCATSALGRTWFVPLWIVGLGPIDNGQATLEATQIVGSGARFPLNFDPANVHQQVWGELTFTFSDCDHANVQWSIGIPG